MHTPFGVALTPIEDVGGEEGVGAPCAVAGDVELRESEVLDDGAAVNVHKRVLDPVGGPHEERDKDRGRICGLGGDGAVAAVLADGVDGDLHAKAVGVDDGEIGIGERAAIEVRQPIGVGANDVLSGDLDGLGMEGDGLGISVVSTVGDLALGLEPIIGVDGGESGIGPSGDSSPLATRIDDGDALFDLEEETLYVGDGEAGRGDDLAVISKSATGEVRLISLWNQNVNGKLL